MYCEIMTEDQSSAMDELANFSAQPKMKQKTYTKNNINY